MKTLAILMLFVLLLSILKPKVTAVKEGNSKEFKLLFSQIYKQNETQRQKVKKLYVRSF